MNRVPFYRKRTVSNNVSKYQKEHGVFRTIIKKTVISPRGLKVVRGYLAEKTVLLNGTMRLTGDNFQKKFPAFLVL